MKHFLLTVIFLTLIPLQNCYAITISFVSESSVIESEVTLADIAQFSKDNEFTRALGSQIIWKAAEPGKNITISPTEVRSLLSSTFELPPDLEWEGPDTIVVNRLSILIGPNKIEDVIDEFLSENSHNLPQADITFKAKTLPLPFHVPKGDLSWEVIPSSPNILESSAMTIIFKVDGRVRKNISLRGKIQALTDVVIARIPLRRGTKITYDQITLATRDISKMSSPCFEPDQIVGKVAATNIRLNDIIELTDIKIPPVIRKGELVKITLRSTAFNLTATGIAKMDGKINDIIRVRNTSSNKMVHCRVSGPGIVEVNI